MSEQNEKSLLETLYPGSKIELDVNNQLEAQVFPLGVKHLKTFQDRIMNILGVIGRIPLPKEGGAEAIANTVIPIVAPIIVTDAIDLVDDCTILHVAGEPIGDSIEHLPHEFVAPIVETWITESFAGGKWKAWEKAINQILVRFSAEGKEPLTISGLLSRISSEPDTPEGTSLKPDS